MNKITIFENVKESYIKAKLKSDLRKMIKDLYYTSTGTKIPDVELSYRMKIADYFEKVGIKDKFDIFNCIKALSYLVLVNEPGETTDEIICRKIYSMYQFTKHFSKDDLVFKRNTVYQLLKERNIQDKICRWILNNEDYKKYCIAVNSAYKDKLNGKEPTKEQAEFHKIELNKLYNYFADKYMKKNKDECEAYAEKLAKEEVIILSIIYGIDNKLWCN